MGMDWLSKYRVQVDCFTKTVTIQSIGGKKVIFKGEKRLVSGCLISVMMAGKMIKMGCPIFIEIEQRKGVWN